MLQPLRAQHYDGRVEDENGHPIKGVTVMLMGNGGKTALGFTRSGADGRFTVAGRDERKADMLVFSHIGYAKDTVMVSSFVLGQTVKMRQQNTVIREVSVKSERIREHGDTLNYNVGSFKQKQDRSIADVIARMPGLHVNGDGTIEYQGRRINKFYVEGMDLMGKKYSQASENIAADKVKTVQVMQNHQPVKMLRNIDFSEQAALNIVLKDEAKNVWQGVVDAGGGHTLQGNGEALYDNRLAAMLFARKKQSMSLYKNNNSGKDVMKEINPASVLEDRIPSESGLLSDIVTEMPRLEEHRTRMNDSHAFATNWLMKLSGESELRLQVSALADKTMVERETETFYLNTTDGVMISENMNAATYRRELSGELQYKINSSTLFLNNRIRGYFDMNRGEGQTVLNGREMGQYVEPRKRYVADDFNMVKQFGGGRRMAVDAYFSYNAMPGKLLTADSTWQRLNMKSAYWGASTYFMHKVLGMYVKYTAQTTGRTQWLRVCTDGHAVSGVTGGCEKYTETDTRLTPSVTYGREQLKIDASAAFCWVMRSLNGLTSNDIVLQPQVRVVIKPTARWEARMQYAYSWMPQGIAAMAATPVFTSYAVMQRGTGCLTDFSSHRVVLYAGYKNVVKGFFASLNADYRYTPCNVLYSGMIRDDVYHNLATDLRAPSRRLALLGRVARSLRWWRTNIGLTGMYSVNKNKLLMSGEAVSHSVSTMTWVADVSVSPFTWFSADLKSHYIQSRQAGEAVVVNETLNSFVHVLKTNVMPGRWRLEWTNEFYHSNDNSVSTAYFCDFGVSCRMKSVEAGIQINNVFGKNRMCQRIYTSDYSRYIAGTLRPREITFRVMLGI